MGAEWRMRHCGIGAQLRIVPPRSACNSLERLTPKDLPSDTQSKSALQNLLIGHKMKLNMSNHAGRELPAKPSQIVRGGKISTAMAGGPGITCVLWLVLAGLIDGAWIFLFETCWLPFRLAGTRISVRVPWSKAGLLLKSCVTENWRRCWCVSNPMTTRIPWPTSQL
jgi:hypothetical protein